MNGTNAEVRTTRRFDPAWLGLTVATIAWGFVVLRVQWPHLTEASGWWAIDSRRVIEVTGVWLSGGDPYSVYGYVYSPFALLVVLPFRLVGEWAWFAVEVAALVWIMLEISKSLSWPSRILVIIAGVFFLPAMSDLLLGNVTIVLTALALIAVRADRIGTGVAFGIALAAVPKPLFIPLLLWMVAYRRRSLAGTIAGGLVASVIGALILGVDRYMSFLTALLTGGGIPTDFVGNLGLSAVSPVVGVLGNIAALAAVGGAIALLSVDSALMVASLAGVLMGTYAGLYSALPLLISLPILTASHRNRAVAIGGLSLGFVLAMPLIAVISMAAGAVPRPERSRQSKSDDAVSLLAPP